MELSWCIHTCYSNLVHNLNLFIWTKVLILFFYFGTLAGHALSRFGLFWSAVQQSTETSLHFAEIGARVWSRNLCIDHKTWSRWGFAEGSKSNLFASFLVSIMQRDTICRIYIRSVFLQLNS